MQEDCSKATDLRSDRGHEGILPRKRPPLVYAPSFDLFDGEDKTMKLRKIIAIVFAFALIAVACGDDGGDGTFSSGIRDSYLAGCEAEGPGGNFCECTMQEIEKNFSEEEFIKFAIEATEEPPEEFLEIAFACIGELDLDG